MAQQQLIGNEKASVFRGKLNDNFTELYGLTENKLIVQGFEDNYADLTTNRPAADYIDEWWGVNNAQGNVVTFNRKPSGIYKSDGTTWKYQGISLDYVLVDNNFALSDNNDNTKKVQFELSGISTSTTRTLTIPNSNGVIALLNDLHDPVTVTDSSEIDFTLTNQDITASIKSGSIDYSKVANDLKSSTAISASDIDWSSAGVFTKTLTAATTFTFSNLQVNKVITIVLDGNYTITWPSYMDENHLISGEYDGTVKNYIQVHCTNATAGSEEVWWAVKTVGA